MKGSFVVKKLLLFIPGFILSSLFMGCAPSEIVKTDLKTFLENPQEFRDKRVVITTAIKSLTENPAPYSGRLIELSGFVEYGRKGFDWYFVLKDEEGRHVTCYEREYRNYPWIRADMVVREAERKNKKIVAVGILEKSKTIELDWIEYNGQFIDTDYKPYIGLDLLRW